MWRYVPQSIIVAALVAAALFFQPWVLFDPIDRFIHLNGASRSMIPDVFTAGEPVTAAVDRLTRSRYVHSDIDPGADDSATCGNSSACDRRREGFTDFFRKPDVALNIACSLDYVVWIKRSGELVVAARSEIYSLCL